MKLKDRIVESLRTVIDPETGIDVVSMGLIRDLKVEDSGRIDLVFRPSIPTCPLGFKLAFDIRDAILKVEGVQDINLKVVDFIYADKLNEILGRE